MKKRLVMLLAGLLTVLSMGFGLAQFSDVPAGHWAKEAVEALAAKGIIVGFPDGTFRGNEGLTRYQAALIIYRLLQQIQEELKAKGESPTMEALSAEELEALKNAVQELAAELAALGVRVSALEDSAATKEDIARLEALIAELKAQPAPEPGMDAAALQDLADRVEAASIAADTALAQAERLAEQLEALSQDLEAAKGQVQVLGARIESVEQAVQALNELAVLLNQDVLGLQDRVTALEKAQAEAPKVDPEEFASREEIAAVQEFAAALRTDLVGLAEQLSKLGDTLRGLSSDVAKLQGLAADIPALKTLAEANAQEIQNLNEQVALLYQDIVALQEVLSAVETLPVLREELADLKAAFERLQAELPDRVEAASIAADTALVQAQQLADQLEALAQRLEDVKGDLAALGTQVEANSQAIQALNELAVLLNQDVLTLQDRATALEKGLADLRAQVEGIDFEEFATREDVAAVQEFVAALRSDLVNLAEKVSRLEGTVGKLQTDLNGVSGRVSTLERNRLTISGNLRLRYDARDAVAGGFSGYDYDRLIAGTILSTGDVDGDGQVVDDADAAINTTSGSTSALLNLTLQTGKLDARSSGGANTYPELFQFSIRLGTPNTGPIGQNNPSPYDGTGATLYPIGLAVDSLKTTLGIAQGQTLSFVFGRSVNTKFTEYVMDNESNSLGHGFVATLKGLPLGGTLTAAYGEKDPSTLNRDYFKALRLALEPFKGFSLAGSYAQHDVTFEEVGGVDGGLDLGFAKLSGEYFRYGANIFSGTYKEGAYLRAELGPVKANVRGFDAGAAPDPAGLSLDDDNPFRWGQRGFTVEAGLPILGLNLGFLYNAQMDTTFGTPSATAFRASAGLGLPAGFSLSARATLASNTAGQWFPSTYNFTGVPGPASATDYATAIVATLSHDGKAKDALIQGLNLTLSYTNRTLLGGANDGLAAYGDFGGLALGPISVDRVVFRYNDSNLQNTAAGQTLKGGIRGGINLAGLPLNPSLTGEAAYRETQGVGTELKYGFGVRFGQFLFDKSVLEVKAAQYTTTGSLPVKPNTAGGDVDGAFNAAVNYLYANEGQAGFTTGPAGTLSGLYVTWNYWDLAFTYGVFKDRELGNLLSEVFNRNLTGNFGSVFRIQYTVNF